MSKYLNLFRNILMVVFLSKSGKVFAQENYVPGYVIRSTGDSINGFVDYQNWINNPLKISFKKKMNEPSENLTPVNTIEVSVEGEKYRGAIVQAESGPWKTEELNYSKELIYRTDTIFLQLLIDGSKSLFFNKDMNGKTQLYIHKNTGYELLTYKKYLEEKDGAILSIENKRYFGQLSLYLEGCSTISDRIKFTDYNDVSMKKLFLAYYNCTKEAITFNRVSDKTVFKFGLMVGLSNTSLKFKSAQSDWDYLEKGSLNSSTNISGGVYLNIAFPGLRNRWLLHNDLCYTSFNISGDYYNANLIYPTTYHFDFSFSYVKLNTMIRYEFSPAKTTLFLNGGISNGFMMSNKNYLKEVKDVFGVFKTEESNVFESFKKHEIGIIAGAGIQFKKISIEARYETTNGFLENYFISSKVNRVYLLVGYQF